MAVIKQRTIESGQLKLKQLKNDTDLSTNQYKYVVEFPDGDRTDSRFTKEAGLREFDRVLEARSPNSGGGIFGGGLF